MIGKKVVIDCTGYHKPQKTGIEMEALVGASIARVDHFMICAKALKP